MHNESKIEKAEVEEFYDSFADYQENVGLNIRLYTVFNKVIKNGLKRNHKVLEIGCGTGNLTAKFAKYLKKGDITGTDISPRIIAFAQKRFRQLKNINFEVADKIDHFTGKFDFILLIDVLEHIPLNEHKNLFRHIERLLSENAKICINIPHPEMVKYKQIHEPEKRQIIDLALSLNMMINNIYDNNLDVKKMESYSLYNQEKDSIFYVLAKKQSYQKINPRSQLKVSFYKLIQRLKAFIRIHI